MAIVSRSKMLLIAFLLMLQLITLCVGDSSECLAVYKRGGSQAVLRSPECPHRNLADLEFSTRGCQIAMLKGQQDLQEDRAICVRDLAIPFPTGKTGFKEVKVDIAAVFDGHNGPEASDMSSKLFMDYFSLHVQFLSDDARSASHHLVILKEALIRTVHDIDETFSREALKRELVSGSTASIAVMVDGKILAARVGNEKAFLCSDKSLSTKELAKATLLKLRRDNKDIKPATLEKFVTKELTKTEQPDEDNNKIQGKSGGGLVLDWAGVPRQEGQLSHSIGDVSYKRFGFVSTPEITEWEPLSAKDRYFVAASDGVLEKMSLQDVCNALREEQQLAEGTETSSLADRLVNMALKKGSMDNLSALVIPLQSSSQPRVQEEGQKDLAPRHFEL